ncbi:MAG: hypothetical protein KBA97_11240 [Methanothrix sp.]|nr:hypothetical protein [Methanothrix sp.]
MELDIKVLRSCVNFYENDWKGLKLLNQLLQEKNYTPEIKKSIDDLKTISELRSKSAPFHIPSPKVSKILSNKLNIDMNASSPEKWQKNGDKLLEFFLAALKVINKGMGLQ